MRRLVVALAGLAAAAIVGIGLGLAVEARDSQGPKAAAPPRASVSVVRTTITPSVALFGAPVVAELVVVASTEIVDPGTIRVRPDFTPYAPVGQRRVVRTDTATSARLTYRFTLRCLDADCAPDTDRTVVELPGTVVLYRFRGAEGPGTAIVDWPPFEVAARVPTEALSPERWRADVTSLPAVSFERSPRATSIGLLAASILLAILGVVLAWWLARPEARAEVETDRSHEVRASALERALELAREASLDGDSPERRKAYERVARELGSRGLGDLAERARTLAWAPGASSPMLVDELEREALAATNGGRP